MDEYIEQNITLIRNITPNGWEVVDSTLSESDKDVYSEYLRMCAEKISTQLDYDKFVIYNKHIYETDRSLYSLCCADGFKIACRSDNIDVCAYLYSNNDLSLNRRKTVVTSSINIFKKMINGKISTNNITRDMFILTYNYESVKVLRWMLYTGDIVTNDVMECFVDSVKHKRNLEVSVILFNFLNGLGLIDISLLEDLIVQITTNRSVTILKWLFERNNTLIPYIVQIVFDISCHQNCEEMCRLSLSFKNTDTDMSYVQDTVVYESFCRSLNTFKHNIVKCILELYSGKIIFKLLIDNEKLVPKKIEDVNHKEIILTLGSIKAYNLIITSYDDDIERFETSLIFVEDNALTEIVEKEICYQDIGICIDKEILINKIFDTFRLHKYGSRPIEQISRLPHTTTEFIISDSPTSDNNPYVIIQFMDMWYIPNDIIVDAFASDSFENEIKDIYASILGKRFNMNGPYNYKKDFADELGLQSATTVDEYIISKIIKEDSCPLCMDDYNMMLECGHVMCVFCACRWYIDRKESRVCCICRKPVSLNRSYFLTDR